jgi:hypothetical protein
MTPTDTVARQAITEALRGSDRVRFSRFSVSRCALGALLLAIALSFEVWPAIQGHYPWYSAAATVLFSLLGILAFAVAWGSDRNAAAQLQDRELLVWDWRGRCGLVARCEGLWARSPVEDVPEPMGSE